MIDLRRLLAGDVVAAAQGLVGALLVHHTVQGRAVARIVETEAYGGADDAASHAWRGRTVRNAAMFGPPGRLYAYLSHGLHVCANVVTGPAGEPSAVLLRAAVVFDGIDLAAARRGDVPLPSLARGPGNLCRALGIGLEQDGADLLGSGPLRLLPGASHGPPGTPDAPREGPEPWFGVWSGGHGVTAGPRTGVSRAADVPWRFHLAGEAAVSPYRRSPRAGPRQPPSAPAG